MKIYVCFITFKDFFTAMISVCFSHELLMFLKHPYKRSNEYTIKALNHKSIEPQKLLIDI